MARVRKQIVAMGGDSFSAEREGSRRDAYVLASTGSCGEAWERGVILTGVSAGMICWFEAGVTDSFGPLAALRDGLGFSPAAPVRITTATETALPVRLLG